METPATRAANPNRPHSEHVRNTAAGTGGGVMGKLFGVRTCIGVLLHVALPWQPIAATCAARGQLHAAAPACSPSSDAAHRLACASIMAKLNQPSAFSRFSTDSSARIHRPADRCALPAAATSLEDVFAWACLHARPILRLHWHLAPRTNDSRDPARL